MACDGLEGRAAPKGASGRVYVSMIDTNHSTSTVSELNKERESSQLISKIVLGSGILTSGTIEANRDDREAIRRKDMRKYRVRNIEKAKM